MEDAIDGTMNDQRKNTITMVITALIGVIVLIVIFSSFYIVSAGERGILLTWGKPDMQAQSEGLHFKIPIAQNAIIMDTKTQKYVIEKAGAASSDLQTVTTDITLNYYISPESAPSIYQTIGVNYQDKVIVPAVMEVLKASTAQYTAEELITKRPEVKDKIDVSLRDRLSEFHIIVQAVSITNFDFSAQFNTAIEGKVTAEQNALAAKNKLAQVDYEAQQRVTQAKGEADAIAIQAQAINSQGGKDYVQLQAIARWDGKLPMIISDSATPFIDMRNLQSNPQQSYYNYNMNNTNKTI
jgi:regulator of protease activity HflC (stomatin/prohibitin superfamily)